MTPGSVALPVNYEAEQALIGCVLYDRTAYERSEGVKQETFYEPFHQAVWGAIASCLEKDRSAEPLLLADHLKDHPSFEAMGGLAYLIDMAETAAPVAMAREFADRILDAKSRRDMIGLAGEMSVLASDWNASAKDHLEAIERSLFSLAEAGGKQSEVSYSDALDAAVAMAAKAYECGGGVSGLPTGLDDLDAKLGGLQPGSLIIVAGATSMGKTSLATNISLNAIRGNKRVLFFSLEMSEVELSQRNLADVTGISTDRQRRGAFSMQEFRRLNEAADAQRRLPFEINAKGGISIAHLVTRARRHKRRFGLDLVVVDYLQLVTTGERGQGRVQEVTTITRALKALAKDLGVPVIALSQLSRNVDNRENNRPQLSDLRESGSIEQDADVVILIYRESYYLARAEPKAGPKHQEWTERMDEAHGVADIIIEKNRHGPIGKVRLAFEESLTRFSNLAHPIDEARAR